MDMELGKSSGAGKKRQLVEVTGCMSSDEVYKFQIHLSNGTTLGLSLSDPGPKMLVEDFITMVKKKNIHKLRGDLNSKDKRRFNWDYGSLVLKDKNHEKINTLSFKNYKPHIYNFLWLDDGCGKNVETFEDMWDLTPHTDLLKELPEEYTFETALADLIDNSLQAVWSNTKGERRIIRVNVLEDRVSIFDSGPGMDESEENSLVKWGKMGASLHRSFKERGIGGKPPYLKPFFGMFGYGGPVASMHLGRRAVVSSKTKTSKNVYVLHLERDALLEKSDSELNWKTPGGIRDPSIDEIEYSPHGSFTKVEIFELVMKNVNIGQLQCWLKDIYFPYIQCDEVSKTGKTVTPVKFEVNGIDLAEIEGGEIATTNLHSSNGPEFVLQLQFSLKQDRGTSSLRSCQNANARLKCVYFPVSEGKESIELILEKLKADNQKNSERYDDFSRVSIRRLGRLLPDARWAWLPFMDLRHKRGNDKAHLLKRCCFRVKCFIDTDAGMNPTPSKTDLAQQNPFTIALKNFGTNLAESEKAVDIDIYRNGKQLSLTQLEKDYQDWILEMNKQYDEEVDQGEDDPLIAVISPVKGKGSSISSDVGRFHKILKRKGKTWKSGQKVKILKGACPKVHKKNVYATIEYFFLGGFKGDHGGEAKIICRPLEIKDGEGCVLSEVDGSFDLHKSLSVPINIIDHGKCLMVSDNEWGNQVEKERFKFPCSIELLGAKFCQELEVEGGELYASVEAGETPPKNVVAVLRYQNYESESDLKDLDQRYIVKSNSDMLLTVKSSGGKSESDGHVHSARIAPSQCNRIQGVYVFSLRCEMYQKAGLYIFSFSLVDSDCKFIKKVEVKPSLRIGKWKIIRNTPYSVRVGLVARSIQVKCYDIYENQAIFASERAIVELQALNGVVLRVKECNTELSHSKSALVIKDLLIVSSDLDKIQPAYKATLIISSLDKKFTDSIPCIVNPGLIELVEAQPSILDKKLLPDCIVKELQLQMFDAFRNRALKGSKVQFKLKGFQMLDRHGLEREVDHRGCVDLSGLLKVTASCGHTVSITAASNKKVIFELEHLIEKRELRMASKVPKLLTVGSQLEDITFEVVNQEGDVDETIHDEDKGQSHMLTIKADWLNTEKSIRYTFDHGRCNVPAIPLPQAEGSIHFQAKHSRQSTLSLDVELYLEKPLVAPKLEYIENQSLHSGGDLLVIQEPIPLAEVGKKFVMSTQNQLQKLEEDLVRYGSDIGKLEREIKMIEEHKEDVEHVINDLQEPSLLGFPNRFFTKEDVLEEIGKKSHSAAGILCNISRGVPFVESQNDMVRDIIGIVALLGKVNSPLLSRILSDFLGPDQMLAVVMRSFEAVLALEKYRRNGEVDPCDALHAEAIKLGKPITGRFHVICLDDIRPPMNLCFEFEDPQRKLALPIPYLHNGTRPRGFLGFAVNMINLDDDRLCIKTSSGNGLRETLLYRLFGKLQVYRTRADMLAARDLIKFDGAVSLDGGILRENGIVSLGFGDPEICFQVAMESLTSDSQENLNQLEEFKLDLRKTIEKLAIERQDLDMIRKVFETTQDEFYKLSGSYNAILHPSQF